MGPACTVRVGTCNVLYEEYYQRHCKVEAVPLARRCALFAEWAGRAMATHDVLALQEWPYDDREGEAHAPSDAPRRDGGRAFRRHAPRPPAMAGWQRALAAAAKAAGWTLVTHASKNDGLLFAVNTAVFDVLSSQFIGYSPAVARGSKKRGRVLLSHKASGTVVGVVNAHVPWARETMQGARHVAEVFELADAALTPHWIAVGDWNVAVPRDAGAFYAAAFPPEWRDATAALPHATAAGDRADQKIDYITHTPSLRCAAIRSHPTDLAAAVQHGRDRGVEASWFSDHCLVSAVLEVAHPAPIRTPPPPGGNAAPPL